LVIHTGGELTVIHHDRKVIFVGIKFIHLPLVRR